MENLFHKLGITDKASFFKFAKQFLKFGVVGVSNTLIHLGVYYLLLNFNVFYILANISGFLISVCNAYFWNSKFVFKNAQKKNIKSFIKSLSVYSFTFLLSNGLLYFYVEILYISEWVAPLINIVVITPINFLLNKFWAFCEDR
ncbi:MAG: GtrA family protein [Eubacterium sp.]|nr:GtrA family protein [Eubacterium sp.]